MVVLPWGDMDVAPCVWEYGGTGRPPPNMSKNKALLCLQRKVWHPLRKVRYRLHKGIETLNVRWGIANFL